VTVTEPIAITPPPIALMLADLAACVCGALANEGAGPTCWCGLYPGAQVSWDYCGACDGDKCGMGWVQLATIFPYNTFPVGVIDLRCASPLAWGIRVGALRCIPTPDDGELPSPEDMANAALMQYLDAKALHTAIKCCTGITASIETYVPVGPDGGCVGGYWTAYLEEP